MEKRKVVKCVIDEEGRLGITAMGLVDMPAIEENWIALSKMQLAKVDEERRMLYGPALIPDKEILRYDEKGEPYYVYFEKATVSAIAHQFFKKNLQHTTNLQHEIPVTGVTVVESWIKEGKLDKSIQLVFNEVGVAMSGVKNYEAELVLELDQLLSKVNPSK